MHSVVILALIILQLVHLKIFYSDAFQHFDHIFSPENTHTHTHFDHIEYYVAANYLIRYKGMLSKERHNSVGYGI